jgi:H+/Cl- antiporter ClcA
MEFKSLKHFILFVLMLASFLAFIAMGVFYLMPKVLENPTSIDPMMALLTGLGFGAVAQFYMLLLKDAWQFFFRKKQKDENTGGS